MRKNIDIDETTLTKLKILSAFEDMSVKSLMEKAVVFYVEFKEREKFENMTDEEKLDAGLLFLMQQSNKEDVVGINEIIYILDN